MEGLIAIARDDSLSTAFSDLRVTAAVNCMESTVIFNNHPTTKSSDLIAWKHFPEVYFHRGKSLWEHLDGVVILRFSKHTKIRLYRYENWVGSCQKKLLKISIFIFLIFLSFWNSSSFWLLWLYVRYQKLVIRATSSWE